VFALCIFWEQASESPTGTSYKASDINGGYVYAMLFYQLFLVYGFTAAETSAHRDL
jgi:hypothetical protein